MKQALFFPISLIILLLMLITALCLGRYMIAPAQVLRALVSGVSGAAGPPDMARTIVLTVRLPRIVAAVLIGVALSLSGGAYQAVFRNPLVSPALLGVLAGAGFGAAIGILVSPLPLVRIGLTLLGGVGAVLVSVSLAGAFARADRSLSNAPDLLLLVFGGLVSTALFTALLSIVKFTADPVNQLSDIIFWLMGSLASVDAMQLRSVAVLMIAGSAALLYLGRYLDILALGDDEARSLGLPVRRLRLEVIGAATVTAAACVAIAGMIGWVGLIIPHIARMIVGPLHRRLMPMCASLGASFMLITDTLARNLTPSEVPIGIICDLLGISLFVLLLPRIRRSWL